MRNRSYPDDPPFAMFPSHWVALALRSNTVVRGVQIAAKLKEEVLLHFLSRIYNL
jgi:hypothetical protein